MPRNLTSAAWGAAGHEVARAPLVLGLPTAQAGDLVLPKAADKRSQAPEAEAPEDRGPQH